MYSLIRKIQEERFPHLKDEEPSRFISRQEYEDAVHSSNDKSGEDDDHGRFLENNAHIARFAARPNVDPQDPDEVSTAYEAMVYPKLISLLSSERLILRQKALYSLIELFLQSKENIVSAINANVMEPCMDLVDDGDMTVRENALSAIGFLVTVKKGRDQFVRDQLMAEIIPCVNDDSSTMAVRFALRVMKNISRFVDTRSLLRDSGCIPVLVSCMEKRNSAHIKDKEQRLVLVECLQALQNSLDAEGAQEIALEAGAICVLNRLLQDMEMLRSSALLGCGVDKEVHRFVMSACGCVAYIWYVSLEAENLTEEFPPDC